jgi:hypothetical protein
MAAECLPNDTQTSKSMGVEHARAQRLIPGRKDCVLVCFLPFLKGIENVSAITEVVRANPDW